MNHCPPRWLERTVRWLVPPASREHVLGDLSERYRSVGQYLGDALDALPGLIASEVQRSAELPRFALAAFGFGFIAILNISPARWLTAIPPVLLALAILVLRDVYRSRAASSCLAAVLRQGALDVLLVTFAVVISQAVAAVWARDWLLPSGALLSGVALFAVLLLLLKLQSPQGVIRPPAIAGAVSAAEVLMEARGFEAVCRRAIRIKQGAAFLAAAASLFLLGTSQMQLRGTAGAISTAGAALSAAGALLVAWRLSSQAQRRMPRADGGGGFAQSLALYRHTLEQHRQARARLLWHALPLVLGYAALVLGGALQRPAQWAVLERACGTLLVLGLLLAWVDQVTQVRLQRRIAQLSLLE
jgi:hypothetical protein